MDSSVECKRQVMSKELLNNYLIFSYAIAERQHIQCSRRGCKRGLNKIRLREGCDLRADQQQNQWGQGCTDAVVRHHSSHRLWHDTLVGHCPERLWLHSSDVAARTEMYNIARMFVIASALT